MSDKFITQQEMQSRLKKHIRERYGTEQACGDELGYAQNTIAGYVTGKRTPHKLLLNEIGVEKVTMYRVKEQQGES